MAAKTISGTIQHLIYKDLINNLPDRDKLTQVYRMGFMWDHTLRKPLEGFVIHHRVALIQYTTVVERYPCPKDHRMKYKIQMPNRMFGTTTKIEPLGGVHPISANYLKSCMIRRLGYSGSEQFLIIPPRASLYEIEKRSNPFNDGDPHMAIWNLAFQIPAF